MAVLIIIQLIVSLVLVGVILLQNQGSGLSTTFGGGGEFYRSRRSIEKLLFWVTVAITILFGALSLTLLASEL